MLLLINFRSVQAQLSSTVYETFTQTMVNPYLINPANSDSSYSFKACFNNINELGLLKNVSKFYFDGDKRFNSVKKNEYHFLGIQTNNSKIGDYISRSRLQLRYSWFTQLSKKTFLSSGISMGFVNYAFETTQGGTGGSDYGPDGSVGVHILRPGASIGFAIQQIFTPVLMPVNQSFQFLRLYNVDLTKELKITSDFQCSLFSVFQVSEVGNYAYSFGTLSRIANMGLIGINNFNLKKTTVNVGVENLAVLDIDFTLMASYSFHHSGISLPDNTLELFIAIQK